LAWACLSLVRANDTVAQAEPIYREVSTSSRHAADLVGLLGAAIRASSPCLTGLPELVGIFCDPRSHQGRSARDVRFQELECCRHTST
jgi:hypothetical protein